MQIITRVRSDNGGNRSQYGLVTIDGEMRRLLEMRAKITTIVHTLDPRVREVCYDDQRCEFLIGLPENVLTLNEKNELDSGRIIVLGNDIIVPSELRLNYDDVDDVVMMMNDYYFGYEAREYPSHVRIHTYNIKLEIAQVY